MIKNETRLQVLDNSGGLIVKCFRIYGKKEATLGNKILISIKTCRVNRKVKKGEIYKGIVVQIRSLYKRKVGQYLKFNKNGVVLWKRKEDTPVGTRVRYIVPIELRFLGFMKIILLAIGTF